MMVSPVVVCVVGKKKSGKTTLVLALVEELRARGHRVMSAKHGHHFQIDQPETDSWKHRVRGGAERVLLTGPDGMGVFETWPEPREPSLTTLVDRFLSDADIVIAEGFKTSPYPKIEVFRTEADPAPWYGSPAMEGHRFLGVVTDDPDLRFPVPVLALGGADTIAALCDSVEGLIQADGSTALKTR